MKNFTYHSTEEKENIEAILRQRKRKLNRQQILAGTILGLIVLVLGLYFGYYVYYTEYDGYMHVDENRVRTPFDIYLDSVYVKTGDIVAPGDTLYSYYMLDMLVQQADPNNEPGIVARYREISLRYESTARDIKVLRVRIEELKKQIDIEVHNIRFGLSSNAHKLDLERELKESEARLQALNYELGVLKRMKRETSPVLGRAKNEPRTDTALRAQIYDNIHSESLRGAIAYRLAGDSSIITQVNAPDRMIFFEKEEILTKQHLNLEGNNLQVVAYVPVDQIHRITNDSRAEVLISDDIVLGAHVAVLGMRAEMIPEHLRSYFNKRNTVLIAIFNLDAGQTVPFWSMTSGLPVKVRVRNSDTWFREATPDDYLWFTTGKGVQTPKKLKR
ncbi:MAG: SPOR domain-containing protein [Odoribacter sp.]|nr:SPOR domain-containing protein [Odoribacter sp.]